MDADLFLSVQQSIDEEMEDNNDNKQVLAVIALHVAAHQD
jgi:hypothetical protein